MTRPDELTPSDLEKLAEKLKDLPTENWTVKHGYNHVPNHLIGRIVSGEVDIKLTKKHGPCTYPTVIVTIRGNNYAHDTGTEVVKTPSCKFEYSFENIGYPLHPKEQTEQGRKVLGAYLDLMEHVETKIKTENAERKKRQTSELMRDFLRWFPGE